MPGAFATLADLYNRRIEQHRNWPFLRAVMAACAVVASADGDVSLAKRSRVNQILLALDRLKVFDPQEGVDLFNGFTNGILANPAEGHAEAIAAIEPMVADPAAGELLLRICLAISEAEHALSLADQIEIVSLCSRFGIDPSDCGLYIDMPVEAFLAMNPPKAREEP